MALLLIYAFNVWSLDVNVDGGAEELKTESRNAKGNALGVLRVITRPEFDPTRSKEKKYPTRTRPKNLKGQLYPTRPVPEFFSSDPKNFHFQIEIIS